MVVAVSIPQTELAKHPDIGKEISALSIQVVEHAEYCEYVVEDWKVVLSLLSRQKVAFVFKPL
jgi:hypothetical protein